MKTIQKKSSPVSSKDSSNGGSRSATLDTSSLMQKKAQSNASMLSGNVAQLKPKATKKDAPANAEKPKEATKKEKAKKSKDTSDEKANAEKDTPANAKEKA